MQVRSPGWGKNTEIVALAQGKGQNASFPNPNINSAHVAFFTTPNKFIGQIHWRCPMASCQTGFSCPLFTEELVL